MPLFSRVRLVTKVAASFNEDTGDGDDDADADTDDVDDSDGDSDNGGLLIRTQEGRLPIHRDLRQIRFELFPFAFGYRSSKPGRQWYSASRKEFSRP